MDIWLINLFSNMLDTILVFYYLLVVLNKKDIDLKKCGTLLAILIIINTIINTSFGMANFLGYMVILTISSIAYSYILKEEFFSLLIHSISATILMGVLEVIFIAIICLVFDILPSVLFEVNVYRIITLALSKLALFFTTKYLIKYLLKKVKFPQVINFRFNISLMLIFLFNIFVIFMTYIIYKYLKQQTIVEHLHLIGLGLGTLMFNWLIYNVTKESLYRNQQEIIWKMKEEEFYKSNFYINNVKEILQTIRAEKHELNNYLSTLYGLIYLGNYNEAKEYITKINNRISFMNNIIETNNPIITAILNIQRNKAFLEGIQMEIDIDELPEELPFDSVDLSIVIGNLLNNAMEACISLGKDKPRRIQFSMGIEKEELIIYIKNSKSNLRKLDVKEIIGGFTTKEDKESHGFGLRNVNFIINQYNGTLNLEDLGNEFRVYITLPMKKGLINDVKATTDYI